MCVLQVYECLSQLIVDHVDVTRWLFKLDAEFDGRGVAALDVDQHLRCYSWVRKEAARSGHVCSLGHAPGQVTCAAWVTLQVRSRVQPGSRSRSGHVCSLGHAPANSKWPGV